MILSRWWRNTTRGYELSDSTACQTPAGWFGVLLVLASIVGVVYLIYC